jgi:molybdenum cofactor guanylyltransferase
MIAALVLAGGQARRLGGLDKAFLDIGGQTALAHVLARLTGQAAAIAISANGDVARFSAYGLPVLPDGDFANQGPLAGLLAGLDWAARQGAQALLSVPCDTPFIPADLAATLAPAPACAESLGRVHHLVALWPVAARLALRALLERPGPRGVARFAESLGMRTVAYSEVAFPGGSWDPFLNINTPDDLALAGEIARRQK